MTINIDHLLDSVSTSTRSLAMGVNSVGNVAVASSSTGAVSLGGSYASGTDSFAAANADNTGTYGAQGANSIAIGYRAKATTSYAIAIGSSPTASGTSAVALGNSGSAQGNYSFAVHGTAAGNYAVALGSGSFGVSQASGASAFACGDQTAASGQYSVALGARSKAVQYGKYAFASGIVGTGPGDAQYGLMVLLATPASGSTGVLTSDAGAATTTNQLIVASGQAMTVTGMIVGKVTGTAQVYSATFTAQLINNGGTVTLGAAVTLANVTDGITLTTAPTVTADNTNKGLAVTSGAKTATVIKWVCTVQSCEITY